MESARFARLTQKHHIRLWGHVSVCLLDLVYLGLLVVLLAGRPGHFLLIDKIPNPIGVVPLGVIWIGALGALTLSFYGVFEHFSGWDVSFNLWHICRPFMGAILGAVSYLILVGVLNATGRTDPNSATLPANLAIVPYLVLGFVVGFRESVFRRLLERAADLLLGPGIPGQTPLGVTLVTSPVDASALTTRSFTATIMNQGATPAALSGLTATVQPPTAATVAPPLKPGQALQVNIPVVQEFTVTPADVPGRPDHVLVRLEASGSFGTVTKDVVVPLPTQ